MQYWTSLENLSAIEVSGTEAETFLANQFAADVVGIAPGSALRSAWCNPKGRILFAPLVYRQAEHFVCLVDTELTAAFCQRLQMFILRADVSVRTIEDARCVGARFSPDVDLHKWLAESSISDATLLNLSLGDMATTAGQLTYLVMNKEQAATLSASDLPKAGLEQWLDDQIALGIPDIFAAVAGEFLPQQVNLDALDGVSFKKGCYPGQEIIARVKYRGKIKQRLYCLDSDEISTDSSQVKPLCNIYAWPSNDKKVGQILQANVYGGGFRATAVVDVAFVEESPGEEIFVQIENVEAKCRLTAPPYSIPE